jgi:hypothetical protein
MEIYLPKEDVFVAVFSNCDCNSPELVTARMAALAIGKPIEYKEIPVAYSSLNDYTGVYENEKGQLRIITLSDNGLYSQIGRGPKSNIKAYQIDKFFLDELSTLEFSRSKKGNIEKLITKNLNGNDIWNKTNKPIPSPNGMTVDQKILNTYVGDYEVTPEFTFTIIKDQVRLFIQAIGQEKFELFAETETKFFTKINDAQIEFVKDASGKITKVIMKQGGRQTEARKIK